MLCLLIAEAFSDLPARKTFTKFFRKGGVSFLSRTLKHTWPVALVLSLVMVLSVVFGSTLAYMVTQTPSIINTFLSGIDPMGTLTIQKVVDHPYGEDYIVPSSLEFGFTADLGIDNAGKTFGGFTADENGLIHFTLSHGGSVEIPDIPEGTVVKVTEDGNLSNGFTAPVIPEITMGWESQTLVVTNTYVPAPAESDITITGRKILEGRDWEMGDKFEFALQALTYNKETKEYEYVEIGRTAVEYTPVIQSDPENPDDPDKNIEVIPDGFDTFNLTEVFQAYLEEHPMDKVGTYSFRIVEIKPEEPLFGITYDEEKGNKFEVIVEDKDMDGELEIANVYSYGNIEQMVRKLDVEFTNIFDETIRDSVTIEIQKKLVDSYGNERDPRGFIFELYEYDRQKSEPVAVSEITDTNGSSSIMLTYGAQDVGETFLYVLKERQGQRPGITYSEETYAFEVTVIGNADGTISAEIGEYDPEAEKLAEAVSGEERSDAEIPASTGSQTDLDKIAQYNAASEIMNRKDENTSADENDESSSDEPDDDSEPAEDEHDRISVKFTNTYAPAETKLPVGGIKTLKGRPQKKGEFTFQIFETEAGYAIAEGATPIRTAVNTESVYDSAAGTYNSTFVFEDLVFTEPGRYYFVVKEDASDALGGITYDTAKYYISVLVEDDGNGKLVLSAQDTSIKDTAGKPVDEISFHNTYKAGSVWFKLEGNKVLIGRQLKAKEFTFKIYEADYLTSYGFRKLDLWGKTQNDSGATGTVTGEFSFRIEYAAPGTYHYIIVEDIPEDAKKEKGMNYDDTAYGIEIVVTDNLNGQLQAEITKLVKLSQKENETDKDAKEIRFCNIYTPEEKPDDPTRPTTKPDVTGPTDGTTNPDDTTQTTTPGSSGEGKLPQTGQLWWPVPIMLMMGIMFVAIGLVGTRGIPDEKKKK